MVVTSEKRTSTLHVVSKRDCLQNLIANQDSNFKEITVRAFLYLLLLCPFSRGLLVPTDASRNGILGKEPDLIVRTLVGWAWFS